MAGIQKIISVSLQQLSMAFSGAAGDGKIASALGRLCIGCCSVISEEGHIGKSVWLGDGLDIRAIG